jgi:enamine deaminase RidA (YjgF/YER057c/UK114 family)
MIPVEFISVLPDAGGTPGRRGRECLDGLLARLRPTRRAARHVLSLAFFVDAVEAGPLRRAREGLAAVVRELFGASAPPVSVIAQAPEGGRRAALEAVVLAAGVRGVRVRRRSAGGEPYTLVEADGVRQVHAAGLFSGAGPASTASRARRAFARMEAILARERMDYGHVLRQWNYVERLLDFEGCPGCQPYQAFSDVRSARYARADFPAGYPASTGIGQAAGGVLIEFVALDGPPEARVEALTNPRQVDAHRYSDGVLVGAPDPETGGRTPPKFERGKLVARAGEETVFVSGTAAILGEKSVAEGDVTAQTTTSVENVRAILGGRPPRYLRAYVKHAADIPEVRRVCERAFGTIPSLCVVADVCREELLVEIEAALVTRAAELPVECRAVREPTPVEGPA